MISLKFKGLQIGASAHDLTKNEWSKLKGVELNYSNISEVLNGYDIWSANYFTISRPVIDEYLTIEAYNKNSDCLWSGDMDGICDIYDHSSKFPEIEDLDDWSEPDEIGDAVAWEEHPYILYYEELNQGLTGVCNIDVDNFDPKNLSIVEGVLETDDSEWGYVSKIFYEGNELKFEPLETDLKNKHEKFKLID